MITGLGDEKEEGVLEFLHALKGLPIDWEIRDYWEGDRCAIGVASRTQPSRLAYVSCWAQPPNHFFVELEEEALVPDEYLVIARLESSPMDVAIAVVERHLSSTNPENSGR